jgi:hypothetical protein
MRAECRNCRRILIRSGRVAGNSGSAGKKKKSSAPDAEEAAAKMVFCIDLAARAETADQFHARCRRLAAGAEEFGRLVFFKRVFFVVLAVLAVLPADRPVLFGVFYNRFVAGFKHERRGLRLWVIDLFT